MAHHSFLSGIGNLLDVANNMGRRLRIFSLALSRIRFGRAVVSRLLRDVSSVFARNRRPKGAAEGWEKQQHHISSLSTVRNVFITVRYRTLKKRGINSAKANTMSLDLPDAIQD